MLPLMMDLCKACAKSRSLKAKLALRERLVAVRHQLMIEAVSEYQAEIAAGIDVEEASDDYFDLKGFVLDCERSCFECGNSEEAKMYLIIREYLEICHGGGQAPAKKDPPADKAPTQATQEKSPKEPARLADYRLKDGRKDRESDK